MPLTCNHGRMPGPCQFAWGVTIIACIAVVALVLGSCNGATGADPIAHPAPAKEAPHAQP